MSDGEHRFITELNKEIGEYEARDDIVFEYKQHIYEMKREQPRHHEFTYDELVQRLGSPLQIAKMWKKEITVTPKKMQWLFIISNIVIFLSGTLLTISYHIFELAWIDQLWHTLTNISFIIMFVYLLFWGLLGYEIGKEFGHRGRRLLQRTFGICIIPNIVFMYLVVFKVLPHEWFDPLLNVPFIMICIVFTALLYPVSMMGYRWGRKASV